MPFASAIAYLLLLESKAMPLMPLLFGSLKVLVRLPPLLRSHT